MHYTDPVQEIISRLESVSTCGAGWLARCPAHDDRKPSLSIDRSSDGRALLHCFRGCKINEILAAIGLEKRDLFPVQVNGAAPVVAPAQQNGHAGAVIVDFNVEAVRLTSQLDEARLRELAADLGVTAESLQSIGCGWATRADLRRLKAGGSGWQEQYPDGAFSFPERNGTGEVVGISFRAGDGRKGFAGGGKRGLTVPDDLPADGSVLVVEGASDVAAGLTLGLPVVGRPSASAGAEDLATLLEGYDVLVVAERDGDEERSPGLEGAIRVRRVMRERGAKSVEVVRMPAAFKDLRTWVRSQQRHGLDLGDRDGCCKAGREVMDELRQAVLRSAPPPAGLEWQPFPLDALPAVLSTYVIRVAASLGCDPAFLAVPMLPMLAACIGTTRVIELKQGWAEFPILWAALIAPSGSKKTPALEKVVWPLRTHERERIAEYRLAMETHEAGDGGGDAPVCQRHLVADVTTESLIKLLSQNPRGLLMARDELGAWVRDFNRYRSGRGGDLQVWLEMHQGNPVTVDRKTGPDQMLHAAVAAVSVTGCIQPGTLDRILQPEFFESGFAARLLLAQPPVMRKVWSEDEIPEEVLAPYQGLVLRLLALRHDETDPQHPIPIVRTLTQSGKEAWKTFYNQHAAEQEEATNDMVGAMLAKVEAAAARLALIIHEVRRAEGDASLESPGRVDGESVRRGVVIARWFAREARRLYASFGSVTASDRADVIRIIRARGGRISANELARATRRFESSAEALEFLNRLGEEGYGTFESDEPPGGGRPTTRFVLKEARASP